MSDIQIDVAAGAHNRYSSLVSVDLEASALTAGDNDELFVTDAEGVEYPAQRESQSDGKVRVTWLIPHMRADEVRRFTLHSRPLTEKTRGVRLVDRPGEGVDIFLGEELFSTYQYGTQWARPFLYPVMHAAGVNVTRHFPIKPDVPGETHDHPHHKSVFFTHGDVNGVDNWSEQPGHGTTRHQSFSSITSGPVFGELHAHSLWMSPEDEPYLQQELMLRVYGSAGHTRLFDATLRFHAAYGDVVFGDTKEGGLLSVRVATTMDASGAGRIETSTGAIGEKESWGKRASWCHYSGPLQTPKGPLVAGIGILDHPMNPRYPTYWHVRNYGLMTANPFGLSYFYKDKSRDGSLKLPSGESLVFRYRVVIHEGDAQSGHMAEQFASFAYPLAATVV